MEYGRCCEESNNVNVMRKDVISNNVNVIRKDVNVSMRKSEIGFERRCTTKF